MHRVHELEHPLADHNLRLIRDRDTDAAVVNAPDRAGKRPVVEFELAQQRAHEAEPGLMETAHAREPHHLIGTAPANVLLPG